MKLKEPEKTKVIIDTSSYVAAVISKSGVSAEILGYIIKEKILNFYTEEILNEVEEVLARSKFRLEKEKQDRFIHLIQEASFKIISLDAFKIKRCRDPKDDKFLSLARQIEADFIISWDEDLLSLKNEGETKMITPFKFLKLIKDN